MMDKLARFLPSSRGGRPGRSMQLSKLYQATCRRLLSFGACADVRLGECLVVGRLREADHGSALQGLSLGQRLSFRLQTGETGQKGSHHRGRCSKAPPKGAAYMWRQFKIDVGAQSIVKGVNWSECHHVTSLNIRGMVVKMYFICLSMRRASSVLGLHLSLPPQKPIKQVI